MLKWKCHKEKLWKLCETAIEIVNENKNRVTNFERKKRFIFFSQFGWLHDFLDKIDLPSLTEQKNSVPLKRVRNAKTRIKSLSYGC